MSECPYCVNSFEMTDTCYDDFEMWQGLVGPYYSPSIENGVLTWTNTGGLPNPDPISVVGPPGNGLYIGGIAETVSGLPETTEEGVTWLVGTDDPYEGYVFLDGSWVSIGQLALGPAGPAGPVGPTGPVGPAGSIGPPGIEVSDTAPTSDVLAWIDTDEDTEILVPEMHTTSTPNVLNMGSEYLDAAAVYDRTQGKTQAAINSGSEFVEILSTSTFHLWQNEFETHIYFDQYPVTSASVGNIADLSANPNIKLPLYPSLNFVCRIGDTMAIADVETSGVLSLYTDGLGAYATGSIRGELIYKNA